MKKTILAFLAVLVVALAGFAPPAAAYRQSDLDKLHQYAQLLQNHDCQECNLTDADLSGIRLVGANLFGAALGGANLSGANLSEVNFAAANLKGVRGTFTYEGAFFCKTIRPLQKR